MALDLNDKSPNGNTLTNNGATESNDTPFSQSTISANLELSEGDYLSAIDSTSLSFTDDFTIEVWFKLEQLPSTAGTDFVVVAKDAGGVQRSYFLDISTLNQLRLWFFDSAGNITRALMDELLGVGDVGVWVHISVVVDVSGPSVTFYKNTVSKATTVDLTAATSVRDSTAILTIGANGSATNFFDGLIDEVRIWNDLRSSGEITANYNIELDGTESNLVAYWPFETLLGPPPPLKTKFFDDDFSSDTRNSAKWTRWQNNQSIRIRQGSGNLNILLADRLPGSNYDGYLSTTGWDLVNDSIFVKVDQPARLGTNALTTFLFYSNDDSGSARIYTQNGTLNFLYVNEVGSPTIVDTIPFDAVLHKYWRFRNVGGTLYYETSKNGKDWVVKASHAATFVMSNVSIALYGETSQMESTPGEIKFGPFNILKTGLTDKSYYYKVYGSDGVYVTTWSEDVISLPSFDTSINNGPGELIIRLARDFDNFGETVDVDLNNKVECYCVDKDNPNGLLIYSGYVSGYQPVLDERTQYVNITVLGFATELTRMVLRDLSGNTTVSYLSKDPANILKDVIDKLVSRGCHLGYTSDSIQLTNTTVSYTFNTNTGKECLDKVIELCPVGWYYRIDPNGYVYLKPKNDLADHRFFAGREIEKLETFRRIENVVNRILFVGGGSPPLFRVYENTGSQGEWGLYEEVIVDSRVTLAATASIISNRILSDKNSPEIRSIFTIIDNNGKSSRGYDIETVKVGQTLLVGNLFSSNITSSLWDQFVWDTDVWDQSIIAAAANVLQILSVKYAPDSIVIEASSRLPIVAKRIEDVNRNLVQSQTSNNPSAPS